MKRHLLIYPRADWVLDEISEHIVVVPPPILRSTTFMITLMWHNAIPALSCAIAHHGHDSTSPTCLPPASGPSHVGSAPCLRWGTIDQLPRFQMCQGGSRGAISIVWSAPFMLVFVLGRAPLRQRGRSKSDAGFCRTLSPWLHYVQDQTNWHSTADRWDRTDSQK